MEVDSFWNKLFFGLEVAGLAVEAFSVTGTCAAHLSHAKHTQWYEEYNLMSSFQKDGGSSKGTEKFEDEYDDEDYDDGFLGWIERTSRNPTFRKVIDGATLTLNIISIY